MILNTIMDGNYTENSKIVIKIHEFMAEIPIPPKSLESEIFKHCNFVLKYKKQISQEILQKFCTTFEILKFE